LFENTEDVISETVNLRRADNTMVKRKTTDNALKNTTPKKRKKRKKSKIE
jgi:hypothetical protein